MKQLIPNQFLFRFAVRCKHRAPVSGVKPLAEAHRVPCFAGMDGAAEFADVRLAWNPTGLTIQWSVAQKREPLYGEADRPNACDGMTLWIDARDTRTIHRATRYCHQFFLLAHSGEGAGDPKVLQRPIHRALEDAPTADLSGVRVQRMSLDENGEAVAESKRSPTKAYWMQVFVPASVIHGYEPDVNSRLGFCYRIRDREMGDQLLAPGPEFPFWEDPSLWAVLELQDSSGGRD
jgi:hypothetical protein